MKNTPHTIPVLHDDTVYEPQITSNHEVHPSGQWQQRNVSSSQSRAGLYDKDYYENGIPTQKSGYMNYRWLPELTIPHAYRLVKLARIQEHEVILDYGSAKGYLVYALRLLGFKAYGCDISEYAVGKTHEEVVPYNKVVTNCAIPFSHDFDWIITKDVLEHVPYDDLAYVLGTFAEKAKKCFIIVPMGDGKRFNIPEYENDVTHVIREDAGWWNRRFEDSGLEVLKWSYDMSKIKESWQHYKKGNGFFILKSRFTA
jgi:SAM-dependent methyltransferase